MNQPANPPVNIRPSGATDAPDIWNVIRRYIVLIVSGTALGTFIATGLWIYFYRYMPKYTAAVTFQVLPPAPGLTEKATQESLASTASQEEISQFINRQIIYIKGDAVLNTVLRTDEFQLDPNTGRRSKWLTEHTSNPKKWLRKDLSVDAKTTAAVFTISMTTDDNVEAANLVNAVARVYMDELRSDNKQNQSEQNHELNDVVAKQEQTVKTQEDSLGEFRKTNDISAIVNLHELELTLLSAMNSQLLESQSRVVGAKASLENINDQLKNGTLQLSSDMRQYVENQPEMLNLNQTRLALDQDKQVTMQRAGASQIEMQALDTRIRTVDRQIAETRAKLEDEARQRMQERAQSDYDSLNATTKYLEKARNDKMSKIQDLDHFLVEDQQRSELLKNQKDILNDLQQKYTLSQVQNSTDDVRIRKLGGDAIAPEKSEISWPLWYYFTPVGFLLGLLGSFGLAYVIELTNTRVRTPADITKTIQLPLLGFVPDQDDDDALTGAITTSIRTSPSSMIAESFRQIRGRLIAQANGHPVSTLLVASVAPGGGATTVASNLANGMALNKMRVLLVDANFYRPGLKLSYPQIPSIGLSEVIGDPTKLDSAIVASQELPNLHVMGAGARPTITSGEILESKSFGDLLTMLKSRYDIVIFDGAPLNLVADSASIGARVDGVIAVVRAGEVSRGTVVRVREQLRHVRANLLGVVLNAAQAHKSGYFKENYKNFYKYAGPAPAPVSVN